MNIKFHITGEFINLDYINPVIVNTKKLSSNLFYKMTFTSSQNVIKHFYLSILPGFHEMTLNELIFTVESFFNKNDFSFDNIALSMPFFNTTKFLTCENLPSPSLFYIESILFSFLKKELPDFCYQPKNLLISELYLKGDLTKYKESKAIKIKIYPDSNTWEELFFTLKELHNLNSNIKFRLDGNRQFETSNLSALIDMLPKELLEKIDYIEEPFKNFYDSFLFNKHFEIPIALDESFSEFIKYPANYPDNWPAVIKPSLFGISKIYQCLANNRNKRFILSTTFEDASILEASYFLATFNPLESHGLANYVRNPDQKIPLS